MVFDILGGAAAALIGERAFKGLKNNQSLGGETLSSALNAVFDGYTQTLMLDGQNTGVRSIDVFNIPEDLKDIEKIEVKNHAHYKQKLAEYFHKNGYGSIVPDSIKEIFLRVSKNDNSKLEELSKLYYDSFASESFIDSLLCKRELKNQLDGAGEWDNMSKAQKSGVIIESYFGQVTSDRIKNIFPYLRSIPSVRDYVGDISGQIGDIIGNWKHIRGINDDDMLNKFYDNPLNLKIGNNSPLLQHAFSGDARDRLNFSQLDQSESAMNLIFTKAGASNKLFGGKMPLDVLLEEQSRRFFELFKSFANELLDNDGLFDKDGKIPFQKVYNKDRSLADGSQYTAKQFFKDRYGVENKDNITQKMVVDLFFEISHQVATNLGSLRYHNGLPIQGDEKQAGQYVNAEQFIIAGLKMKVDMPDSLIKKSDGSERELGYLNRITLSISKIASLPFVEWAIGTLSELKSAGKNFTKLLAVQNFANIFKVSDTFNSLEEKRFGPSANYSPNESFLDQVCDTKNYKKYNYDNYLDDINKDKNADKSPKPHKTTGGIFAAPSAILQTIKNYSGLNFVDRMKDSNSSFVRGAGNVLSTTLGLAFSPLLTASSLLPKGKTKNLLLGTTFLLSTTSLFTPVAEWAVGDNIGAKIADFILNPTASSIREYTDKGFRNLTTEELEAFDKTTKGALPVPNADKITFSVDPKSPDTIVIRSLGDKNIIYVKGDALKFGDKAVDFTSDSKVEIQSGDIKVIDTGDGKNYKLVVVDAPATIIEQKGVRHAVTQFNNVGR
jgi:hypothetical protein